MADAAVERAPEHAQARDAQSKDEEASTAARKRRALLIIGGVAGVITLGVLLYVLLTVGKETTDDAQVDADVVPLAPHVSGQVVAVPVVENQAVKKGEVVLQLDDRDYQARVAQAQAELESVKAQAQAADAQVAVAEASARGALTQAEANLVGSSRSVSGARAQLEQARATLASRQADLKLAQANIERARELQKANAIPQQQFDQTQAQFLSAEAGVNAAHAAVSAAADQLRRTEAQVNEAEGRVVVTRPVDASIAAAVANAAYQHARVKSAEAALALASLNLEWTRVLAPDDGTVSRISAHPGALLSTGQAVAQFVPVRKYVTANFKETQIGKMHPGQPADVGVDSYGRTLQGKVESLSGGTGARFSLFPPDNATGNFVKVSQRIPVRITLDAVPSGMVLRAGQSLVVTVHVNQ
ncbi:MAG TPA: HlyD family secretion protein [Myxococcaceae bacterium]|nr:HlyD family secretion protein [Myxococcaceae bacterium]